VHDIEPKSLSAAEKRDRLRLAWSDNVGPITFRHLIARYGSARAALEALPDLAARGGGKRRVKLLPISKAEDEMARLEAFGGHMLVLGETAYPKLLAAVEDAPPVLFATGHLHLFEKDAIAIVGARNASAAGRRLANSLAFQLGQAGLVVTSGLARGIDGASHTGAIGTGTIAILGCGLDVTYPKENSELQARIAAEGLLVSEHALGSGPQASHFPRRNRIISGLSRGVLVVEAAPRSGSLITARLAGEQGREVFAVPGSPLDPRAKGANRLIRDGAILVQTAEDILEAFQNLAWKPLADPSEELFSGLPKAPVSPDELEVARPRVRQLLSHTPTPVDDIVRHSELTAASVLTILLELELAGVAVRHPGNRISLS
jgi:DNA processing protein